MRLSVRILIVYIIATLGCGDAQMCSTAGGDPSEENDEDSHQMCPLKGISFSLPTVEICNAAVAGIPCSDVMGFAVACLSRMCCIGPACDLAGAFQAVTSAFTEAFADPLKPFSLANPISIISTCQPPPLDFNTGVDFSVLFRDVDFSAIKFPRVDFCSLDFRSIANDSAIATLDVQT